MQENYGLNQSSSASPGHLSDYIAVLKRRRWVMLLSFILLVGTVSFVSFTMEPVYQASVKIIIEPPSSPMSDFDSLQRFSRNIDKEEFLQTQYHLLQSRELVRRVVERFELGSDYLRSAARKKESAGLVSRISSWFFGESRAASERQAEERRVAAPPPVDTTIINRYLNNLVVSPIRGSQLVEIGFFAASPRRAAQVADAHARAFIDFNVERNHAEAQKRLQWLEGELKRQKGKVEASLAALHAYQKEQNILSLSERQTVLARKIADVNSALIGADSEVEKNQAALTELRELTAENHAMLLLPEISRDDFVRNLRNELALLEIQKSEFAATLGPEHPKMIEVSNRIRQVEQGIDKEVERLRRLVQSNYDRALAVESGLRRQLEETRTEALALQEKQSAYEVLQREAESNQKLYDVLLGQAKEIGLLSVFDSNNVRIVEHAEVPRFAAKPKIFLNIFLACVLGVFLGTGLSFFVEYMDNTVKSAEDVHRVLGLPVLGRIPYERALQGNHFPLLPAAAESPAPKPYGYPSHYGEVAVRLPTRFGGAEPGLAGRVLLVESAAMGEGKTTVLGNIAVNLGKAGFRVLVVDGDFQRPAVHHLFETGNDGGLMLAMNRVLARDISAGSLEACSMGDLFALIALRKYSGRLTVTDSSGAMSKTAFFQGGRLLYLESSKTPLENRLGNMLVRGGFLTDPQLADALEWNRRTGQPLGYILINAGYVKQDELQGPLKLQMREHLQTLFSWKQGTFSFVHGEVETYANERIYFAEDYGPLIKQLSRMAGSPLLEGELLGQIASTRQTNVHLLPAGAATVDPGAINYMLLVDFLELLKQRFDVVLVDTPPLLYSAAAEPLHALADGVVFVVKSGKLNVKTLHEAKSRLAGYDAKIMGVVLNQVKDMNRDEY